VRRLIEITADFIQIVMGRNPLLAVFRQVKRPREAPQGLFSRIEEVFVKVRHREFPDCLVDRLAIAQDGVASLGNSTPIPVSPEQRHDVIMVTLGTYKIENQRLFAVMPENRGGQERTLEAVRLLVFQDLTR